MAMTVVWATSNVTKAGGNGDRVGGRPDRTGASMDRMEGRDRKKRRGKNLAEGMMPKAVTDNRMAAMDKSRLAVDDMNMATDDRRVRIEQVWEMCYALVKKCEKVRKCAIIEMQPEFLE